MALWYQGEANATWEPVGAADYLWCQTCLIEGWRGAWDNDPAGCNFYNGAGLPAAPFRTDGAAR